MNKEYPYEDGDYTVLGPETFTDKDKTVISHQGENYYVDLDGPPAPWRLAVYRLSVALDGWRGRMRLRREARKQGVCWRCHTPGPAHRNIDDCADMFYISDGAP